MNEIELYHVSESRLEDNTILKLTNNDETYYYQKNKVNGKNLVDDILNDSKPIDAPMRNQTFYSFDSIDNCAAYAKNNYYKNTYYYRVKMLNPVKAPMCITDLILKLTNDTTKQINAVKEYWNPTQKWKFNEYLSMEMTIIESVKETFLAKARGAVNYHHDLDLRKQFL